MQLISSQALDYLQTLEQKFAATKKKIDEKKYQIKQK